MSVNWTVLWYQCGVLVCNRPVSIFRFPVGSRNTKPGTRPKNNKSHYISIKTYTTGPKLCNTSQLYLSIPLFYPIWGNTHYSMFPYFGSQWVPDTHKTSKKQTDEPKPVVLHVCAEPAEVSRWCHIGVSQLDSVVVSMWCIGVQ